MFSEEDNLKFGRIKKRIRERRFLSALSFVLTGFALSTILIAMSTFEVLSLVVGLALIFVSPFVLKDSWKQYGLEREVGAIEGAIDFAKEVNSMKVIEVMSEGFNDKEALILIRCAREIRIAEGMKFIFGGS